ncbi:MAG: phosphate ABC transporter substrate-binding protein [Enterococcus sp.]|nr:phosphate ABC transporter substrate-binding protein [Enterococcus sp.]
MKKIGLFVASFGLLLGACAQSGTASQNGGENSEPVKIVAVGSTALQPLVDTAGTNFMSEHPNYEISVQGGGSGTGLSQVSSGAVTIGNSDVFAEEKEGVPAEELENFQVAVVGMAPVVNKEANVKELSKEQLIAIFTGKVTNWKDVGGADLAIAVINRASGSGTRATFEKWGLDGEQPMQAQEQDSSGTVKKMIAETPGAISYLALSYIDETIQALALDGVEPTAENIQTNDWKIWAYGHMYTKGEPTKEVQAFLDYILSDAFQTEFVPKLGYLPVTKMAVSRDAKGEVTNQ